MPLLARRRSATPPKLDRWSYTLSTPTSSNHRRRACLAQNRAALFRPRRSSREAGDSHLKDDCHLGSAAKTLSHT